MLNRRFRNACFRCPFEQRDVFLPFFIGGLYENRLGVRMEQSMTTR